MVTGSIVLAAAALSADAAIVAKVDGVAITAASLAERMNRMGPPPDPESAGPEETTRRRSAALERLIVEEIAYRKAVAAGLEASAAEIDAAIGPGADRHARETIAREIAISRLHEREVVARTEVPEWRIREAYERERPRFVKPEYALVVDVIVAKAEDVEGSRARAESLRALLLLDPDPWSLVLDGSFQVRNYEPRAPRDDAILAAARGMKIGTISEIVEGPSSFHVFRLDEYRPPVQGSFEEARPHLEPALRREAIAARTLEWERSLREGAVVEILELR
jgi:hypothetical protein